MSLKRNILANYVGQLYVTVISIVMVPLYVKYMGIEAYGLVGFYAMLQGWFALLDAGLSPTMGRETARFNGGAIDALSLRRLLRALEGIFIGIALLGAIAIITCSGFIASSWLKVQQLSLLEVQHAVILMAVIIAFRWTCALYRSAITGFEQLVWLNVFNSLIATAKSVVVILYFIYVGSRLIDFFSFQLAIAFIELLILIIKAYRLMPALEHKKIISWQWEPLRKVLKFTLSVAFTRIVWVMVTQTDKLLLSKMLPLSEYAYFSLAVLLASGIRILSTPISGALYPRMAKLNAEGNEKGLIRLYRNATQLTSVITMPVALVLAFFAEQALWAWTGDAKIAHNAYPILTLYALGNGILALGSFPHSLQWAKGDLKLHVIGNALFLILFVPSLIWATVYYGVIGAGYSWLSINSLYFLILTPLVHWRFVKGLHKRWLLHDVTGIFLMSALFAAFAHQWVNWPTDRISVAILLIALTIVLVIMTGTASSYLRKTITTQWKM